MAGSGPGHDDWDHHRVALLDGLTFAGRRKIFVLLMGAPAVAYVLAVTVWPLSQGIYFSFFDYSLLRPTERTFVGLANYRELLTDPAARSSILTTALFTVAAVGLEFVLGFCLALLLWRDSLLHRVCLALLLIPVTVTPLVVGLIFRALLGPRSRSSLPNVIGPCESTTLRHTDEGYGRNCGLAAAIGPARRLRRVRRTW